MPRVKEWSERHSEQLSPELVRKLHVALNEAHQREWTKYGPQGANCIKGKQIQGTEYVRVQARSLQQLLEVYEKWQKISTCQT